MKVKKGVHLRGLEIEMRPVIIEAAQVWENQGEELVITSTCEGIHSPGSLHYFGWAVDLRTRYFDQKQKLCVKNQLENRLHKIDKNYRVILHDSHIHVEWRGFIDNPNERTLEDYARLLIPAD